MSFRNPMTPRQRWRLWRQLAKLKMWAVLKFLAPPKVVKLLQEKTP